MDIKIEKIIESKRRTISLVINDKADLLIRCPMGTDIEYLKDIVIKKADWIKKKQEKVKMYNKKYQSYGFIDGAKMLFLGEEYTLKASHDAKEVTINGENIVFPCGNSNIHHIMVEWYKQKANQIILSRVRDLSISLGIIYKTVKISHAKSRWGSCSSKKSLNFSWRLVFAPIYIIDYVIVHELMHTIELNHSKRFWALVKKEIPHYHLCKKWLKDNNFLMKY
ncbi:SprT family zinc-dependent metalloprotease [Clostridiaceae bacterium M8S5]|nr:SprT family zinc-dependent metalloprotease [Clostridiaceae bacterium M8S5]